MDCASCAIAGSSSFSFAASTFTGIVRCLFRSRTVASTWIFSPNFAYFPHTTVSALLNSPMRPTMAGSIMVSELTRRSDNTWRKRSGEIVRRCADCPTSVLSMSARLVPNQSRCASPEPLRKGSIASETSGAAAAVVAGVLLSVFEESLPLNAQSPPAAMATAKVPTPIHFQGIRRSATGGMAMEAETGRLPW